MTWSSVAVVIDCETPCSVTLSGKLKLLPSSLWKTSLAATGAEEVLMSKIVESQPPPAPIWDSAPARVSVAAATTVRLKVCVAVVEALSATRTVKLYVPAVVGVPVIAPALESASPGGRVPDVIVQVYGETPPLAVSACEYVPLVNPDSRGEDVVIVSGGGLIVRLKVLVAVIEALSVTRTVKL